MEQNETITNILTRRSIRSYDARPVEMDKLSIILECGLFAPSGMNTQPWHFTVITNRKVMDKITEENRKVMLQSPIEKTRERAKDPNFDSFKGAPAVIIVSGAPDVYDPSSACANAIENMAIAAQSLGLGSCYLGSFKIAMEKPEGAFLLDELKIPRGYKPLYALILGYGNEILGDRAPRKLNSITYID
jgi:nitroreductase